MGREILFENEKTGKLERCTLMKDQVVTKQQFEQQIGKLNPTPKECMEAAVQSIRTIAEGTREIFDKTELSDRALLILLQDATGLTRREINLVLESLKTMDTLFLKPKKKKAGN